MRKSLVAAAAVMMVSGAATAADMPDYGVLRGAMVDSPRLVRWEGFYIGGQAGYGTSDMDFTNATQNMTSKVLSNTVIENSMAVSSWPVLNKVSSHGQGFGGFVGYNFQWEDVVLGIEANYMHGSFGGSDSNVTDPMGRRMTVDTTTYDVDYAASASIKVKDIGSARLRAGYAFDSFLPYAFGGVSLGQADVSRSISISGQQNGADFRTMTAAEVQNNHFIYGYAGGLGIDMMVYRGLFLRAEWEYLKFAAPINTSTSTVRAGLGYKF
jgi:outer membrane immunogenic protein